jgi:anti-anti-sigma factor
MEFRTIVDAGRATVILNGRLAFASYPDFRAATMPLLELPGVSEIQLDMASVAYLDSSALGMILYFKQKAEEVQKTLVISRPAPDIATILKIVNFQKLIPIIP